MNDILAYAMRLLDARRDGTFLREANGCTFAAPRRPTDLDPDTGLRPGEIYRARLSTKEKRDLVTK